MSFSWKVNKKGALLNILSESQKYFDSDQYAATIEYINSHEWKLDEQALRDFCV